MGKLSFFYKPEDVYKVSLKALQKRDFRITEANEESGVIKAETRRGLLKPDVAVEIRISKVAEGQSKMDIQSSVKKKWLSPEGYEVKAENKLINTLYRLFDSI